MKRANLITTFITLLIGMVLGIGIVTSCKKTEVTKAEASITAPKGWEFKLINLKDYEDKSDKELDKALNKMGAQNWEPAFIMYTHGLYFKRPIK